MLHLILYWIIISVENVQKRQIMKHENKTLNHCKSGFLQNFILKYSVKSLKRTGIIEKNNCSHRQTQTLWTCLICAKESTAIKQ